MNGCGTRAAAFLLTALASSACSPWLPPGTAEEREALGAERPPFEAPHARRELPALGAEPALPGVLRYAFLSNPGIERAYFDWAAALERVPQAVSLENPRLSLEYLFAEERLDRWDRTTLGAWQMIPFPGKLEKAGEIALAEAVAARGRFEDAKFALQAEVVAAFHELAFVDQAIAIEAENVALLREFEEVTRRLVSVGRAAQAEAIKADLELETSENERLSRLAQRPPALADLNRLLSRAPDTPLFPRLEGGPTPLPTEDARIVALAAERNRELQALAAEVRARGNALELARKEYLPDVELGFETTGSTERMLGAMISIPLRLPRIRAGIAEAGAALRAAEAEARARRDDVRAQVLLQLYVARDSERQASLLRETLIPRAREVVDAVNAAYGTGSADFLELLDAQRSLLELRLALAEREAGRARATAALEALCALDFGTLGEATR